VRRETHVEEVGVQDKSGEFQCPVRPCSREFSAKPALTELENTDSKRDPLSEWRVCKEKSQINETHAQKNITILKEGKEKRVRFVVSTGRWCKWKSKYQGAKEEPRKGD